MNSCGIVPASCSCNNKLIETVRTSRKLAKISLKPGPHVFDGIKVRRQEGVIQLREVEGVTLSSIGLRRMDWGIVLK